MTYLEALKKETKDNMICLNDKNKGWIVWGKRFGIYPQIFQGKSLTNDKVVSVLKKQKNWIVIDITKDMKEKSNSKKYIDLSKYIATEEKIVCACSEVW